MIELAIMGPVECMQDGAPLQIRSRKALALLVYLSLHELPQQRESLAYLLWPDATTRRGRASLSRALSTLRRVLGEDAIAATRDTAGLAPGLAVRHDIDALQKALAGCTSHTAQPDGRCTDCLGLAQDAFALLRGPLLQDMRLSDAEPFMDWVEGQREQVTGQALQLTTWLLNTYQQRQAIEAAIDVAQRWLWMHPLHEPTVRQLLRLYHIQQEPTRGRRLYQRLTQSLAQSWALTPEPATTALYDELFGADQPPGAPAQTVASTHSRGSGSVVMSLDSHDEFDPHDERGDPHETEGAPFVGREEEIVALQALVAPLRRPEGEEDATHQGHRHRLISLVGPGGIGKTRLVRKVGASLQADFPQGVWFVPLETCEESDQIWPVLAERLGYVPEPGHPSSLERQLFAYLKDKQLLLILDNIEQINEIDAVIQACLRETKSPTFLVTSRERLGLSMEQVFVLEGLTYPDKDDESDERQHSAVAFFLQCGLRHDARFSPGPQEREEIARICRWVGGSPLCIELAASWLRALSCRQIREALIRDDAVLSSSYQDIPARQSSQRRVFETTWSMLTPEEQRGFASISVFRGGFQLQAAREVAGTSLGMLRTWIDRFLIWRDRGGRFGLHALLRQYAQEQCAAATPPLGDDLHRRHASHYLGWLQQQEQRLQSAQQAEALRAIESDWANLLKAWRWATVAGEAGLLLGAQHALVRSFRLRGWFREGYALFSRTYQAAVASQKADNALAQWMALQTLSLALSLHQHEEAETLQETLARSPRTTASQALYELERGRMAQQQADFDAAEHHFQTSLKALLTLHRDETAKPEPSEPRAYGLDALGCLSRLVELSRRRGDLEQAQAYGAQSLALARELNAPWALAEALNQQGMLAGVAGEYQSAGDCFEESRRYYERLGALMGRARTLNNQAILQHIQGHFEEAFALREQCLSLCRDLGDPIHTARALVHLGSTARELHRYEEASELAREGLELAEQHGDLRLSIQALGSLAYSSIKQQRWSHAHEYLQRGMASALRLDLAPVGIHQLAMAAELLFAQGHTERGMALSQKLLGYPQSETQTKALLQRLLEKYAPTPNNGPTQAQRHASQAPPDETTKAEETWQQLIETTLQTLPPPPG